MKIVFAGAAWEDYLHWIDTDRKTLERLNALIEECRRHPFKG
nr:type II toxin-antitoxin system YoeB family toxin [Sphingopyxis sp.]